MTESVEAGASLGWRLLATLEGGSLVVATSALIAYTARLKLSKQRHRTINSVLVTNTTNTLGKELKRRLESHGCAVHSVKNDDSSTTNLNKFDSLVIIGAESKSDLDGISRLVSEDVYENLNLLELLSARVRRGGLIAWASAGETSGAYGKTVSAFDTVILASLRHVAKVSHCEPLWVGRCENPERTVERIMSELFPRSTRSQSNFIIRNAAHKVSVFLGRWLKMIT